MIEQAFAMIDKAPGEAIFLACLGFWGGFSFGIWFQSYWGEHGE